MARFIVIVLLMLATGLMIRSEQIHWQVWKAAESRKELVAHLVDHTMILTDRDLDRGFYPGLPWSLYVSGSLRPNGNLDLHILPRPVFEHVGFSRLASALANGLELRV